MFDQLTPAEKVQLRAKMTHAMTDAMTEAKALSGGPLSEIDQRDIYGATVSDYILMVSDFADTAELTRVPLAMQA